MKSDNDTDQTTTKDGGNGVTPSTALLNRRGIIYDSAKVLRDQRRLFGVFPFEGLPRLALICLTKSY